MAGGFTVTPEELDQLVTDIHNVDDSVQSQLSAVRNTVDTVASGWQGAAFTAFQTLINRFDEDARKLQEALRTIADGISGTSSTQKQTEEEQSGAMNTILGRLG